VSTRPTLRPSGPVGSGVRAGEAGLLVVDLAAAGPVRVAVGATAWWVLEALAARGVRGAAVIEVEGSSRALAVELGVSKDTIARALAVLGRAGVLCRVDHRDRRSGRFLATTYQVDLAAAGLRTTDSLRPGESLVAGDNAAPATASAMSPRRPDCSGNQLILLS